MKLILCLYCHDVYKLSDETRTCKCKRTSGRYITSLKAEVSDNQETCVLGFANGSLVEAISMQRLKGDREDKMGRDFTAFIMPYNAPNVKRIKAWQGDLILYTCGMNNHHTFPNGAVQGGAFAKPGDLEAKLKELGIADLTPEERYANLLAAFGEVE